jgi:hypothetical protein
MNSRESIAKRLKSQEFPRTPMNTYCLVVTNCANGALTRGLVALLGHRHASTRPHGRIGHVNHYVTDGEVAAASLA